MKKTCVLLLTLLAAGLSHGAENSADQLIRRRAVEKGPSRTSEARYPRQESASEKIASGIEKAPQVIDSVSAMLDKAPEAAQKIAAASENLFTKKSHIYLRMNVMEPNIGTRKSIFPGFGLGYRRAVGNAAVDLSLGYSKGKGTAHHGKSEFITLPKLSYLYYISPVENQSFYIGPAIALGRIVRGPENRFEGLIPSASIGFEISRRANLLSFFQLDVSAPVVAATLKGHMPKPIAEFAFGAGF
jgi:hypothetical protein